jgi:CO/xanthine dehydrogenase FAD-binding subunit
VIPVLAGYHLVTPASLREALDALASTPGARPFSGGTDLMVQLEAGALPPGSYVSLSHCRELRGIDETASGVAIGATTTYSDMRQSELLRRDYAMLTMAASETGGVATQNRGTIGGNIANASPAADTPPALLVYDAELELVSASGTRRLPYAEFHRGYKKMDLQSGELIARIHLPRRSLGEGWRDYYRKVGTRRAQAISKVCFAGAIRTDGGGVADVRIALGSVAPTVVRARQAEAALRGRALTLESIAAAENALTSEIAPIDDIRSTAQYRARVACNLLREFLGDRGNPARI